MNPIRFLYVKIGPDELPDNRLNNGFRTRYEEHMLAINAKERFSLMLEIDKIKHQDIKMDNKKINEQLTNEENLTDENLQGQSSFIIGRNVTDNSIENTPNNIEENITAPALELPIEPEQIVAHCSDDDASNDSTSTFVLKYEHIDIDERPLMPQAPSNDDNTVNKQQEPVEPSNVNKTVKQESIDTENSVIIKKEHSYSSNQLAKDEINNAINEILDNFNPNEIRVKDELLEKTDPKDVIRSLSNESDNITIEYIICTKDPEAESNVVTVSSESIREANVKVPSFTDSSESTRKIVASGEDNTINNSVERTDRVNVNKTTSSEQYKTHETARDSCSQNSVNQVSIGSDKLNMNLASTVTTTASSENAKPNEPARSRPKNRNAIKFFRRLKQMNVNESDYSKIVHVNNFPDRVLRRVYDSILKIVTDSLPEEANIKEEDIRIFSIHNDDYEGEALLQLPTQQEALRVCEALNGGKADVFATVGLDDIIWDRVSGITERLPPSERAKESTVPCHRSRRRIGDICYDNFNDGTTPAKKSRCDISSVNADGEQRRAANVQRGMEEPRNLEDYGFQPEFLRKLELKTPLSNAIFVNQLPQQVSEAKLAEVFSMAGEVKLIDYNRQSQRARIEYDHPVEAVQAVHMFRNQALYNKEILIEMDYRPKPELPNGLLGINHGFGINGKPLKGVRTSIELREIREILFDMGKMNKFEPEDFRFPFCARYYKRDATTSKTNTLTMSTATITDIPAITNTSNESFTKTSNAQSFAMDDSSSIAKEENLNTSQPSANNNQIIEELGAILKSRGLIPTQYDCKDAKSILAALKESHVNQNDNSNVGKNSENTIHMPPNLANAQQTFEDEENGMPPNVPLAYGGPSVTQPTVSLKQVSSMTVQPNAESSRTISRNTFVGNSNFGFGHPEYGSVNPRIDKGPDSSDQFKSTRVIFRNLPRGVTQTELTKKMQEVGDLLYCEGPTNGCAIVAFNTVEDADRCIRLFHRSRVDGQVIDVKFVVRYNIKLKDEDNN